MKCFIFLFTLRIKFYQLICCVINISIKDQSNVVATTKTQDIQTKKVV
jgi:hypothetical protein